MPSGPQQLMAVADCPGSPQEGPAPAAERVSRAAERRGREEPVDPPGQSADRNSEASQRAARRAVMLTLVAAKINEALATAQRRLAGIAHEPIAILESDICVRQLLRWR